MPKYLLCVEMTFMIGIETSQMVYRSELYSRDGGVDMQLSREVITPSGLIVPTKIASVIFRCITRPALPHTGLLMPSPFEIMKVNESRLDTSSDELAGGEAGVSMTARSIGEFTGLVISQGKVLIMEKELMPVEGEVESQSLTDHEEEALRLIYHGLNEWPDDRPYPGMYL